MSDILTLEDLKNFYPNIKLAAPVALQGGQTYTSRLYSYDNLLNKNPLYFYTVKCRCKNGIVVSDRKCYIDLIFDSTDDGVVSGIEGLEKYLQQAVVDNSSDWFENTITLDDVELSFLNSLRPYQSAKKLVLRCNVGTLNTIDNVVRVYNEDGDDLTYKDITSDTEMICIINISSLRFTSKNFMIDYTVKQIMVLNNNDINSKKLIFASKEKEKEKSKDKLTFFSEKMETSNQGESDLAKSESLEKDLSGQLVEINQYDGSCNAIQDNDIDNLEVELETIEDIPKLEDVELISDTVEIDTQTAAMDISNNACDVVEDKTEILNNNHPNKNQMEPVVESELESVEKPVVEPEVEPEMEPVEESEVEPEVEPEMEPVEESEMEPEVEPVVENDITSDPSETIREISELKPTNLNDLEELEIELEELDIEDNTLSIKEPETIYNTLYETAKKRAEDDRERALKSFLELNKIKTTMSQLK